MTITKFTRRDRLIVRYCIEAMKLGMLARLRRLAHAPTRRPRRAA